MENNKYLPVGTNVAKKYEVIDVLGEDDFEILYLVRDIERKGSFFVLKELFLETFSSREGELVFTVPAALGVFHKRKKQIIEEIKSQKLNSKNNDIKIYGYEDENNTIYTIMEFSSNTSLERYLQFTPKDTTYLPVLNELLDDIEEKKDKSSFLFLKFLLAIAAILAVAFYAFEYFQKKNLNNNEYKLEGSASKEFPKLKERMPVEEPIAKSIEDNISTIPDAINETKIEENLTKLISIENTLAMIKEAKDDVAEVEIEKNLSELIPVVNTEVISTIVEDNATSTLAVVEKVKIEENLTQVNIQKVVMEEIDSEALVKMSIKNFLDEYISASATSVDASLKYYDRRVKKYFKFKNATHKTIAGSQERYNKKWVKREFEISDFEILKSYAKDNINYHDVKTTTTWNVSTKRGKKFSGKSKGFMTLKEVENSFKIISIYTLK